MAQTKTAKNEGSAKVGCAALVVLGLLIWGGIEIFGGSSSGTTYQTTVSDFVVVNPADLAVTLHITNTGGKAGTPDCTVNANDGSYTYTGINEGTLSDSIAPGKTSTTVMQVTITKQGASFVTDVTAKCS